jgi:general stress protein YciG
MTEIAETGPKPKGFAAMSAEKRAQISRMGGKAAHKKGVAHEWSKKEAKAAGQKGGKARKPRPQDDEDDED